MATTLFDTPVRSEVTELKENLGSPSSASGVTGADAFSKISTLNSNFSNYYTKSQSLASNPLSGSFTTDNENSYNTAGTTCVFCNRTIAGVSVAQWFTLIVSGVASIHLEQLLVANNLIFKRVYEGGTWGNWSGGRLT